MVREWLKLLVIGLCASCLILAGCEGDDGKDGKDGVDGKDAVGTLNVESCGVCHADVNVHHDPMDVATAVITDGPTIVDGDLVISFDVAVDDMPDDSFVLRRVYVNYDDPTLQTVPPSLITTFVRDNLYRDGRDPAGPVELVANGNGNYTVTIPAGPGTVGSSDYDEGVVADGTYLIQLMSDFSDERPIVVFANGTSQLRDLVSSDGCANCHGPFPAWSEKFSHYAVGGMECQICHSQATRSITINSKDSNGDFVEDGPVYGTNIVEYVHGIHNSHNMPDGVYYRTTAPDDDFDNEDRYSVGYPSNMLSCNVCHATQAQLDAAVMAPVAGYLCFSCHQTWDGFVDHNGDPIFAESSGHRAFDTSTDCMECHAFIADKDEAGDFHNMFQDPADPDSHVNSFYRGVDISFANENEVTFGVTGVSLTGTAVTFTWEASKLGEPVSPCNTVLASGPVFEGLRAYLGYAKGDDWVNEFVGSSPGQPASNLSISADNTTCVGNEATTTGLVLDEEALTYAKKVLLGIGGKVLDQDVFTIGTEATDGVYYVREPSPLYPFDPSDGTRVDDRRNAVATEKCLACHQGTLYQHGGDRVDNEQLCVICHNPSSGEKNNRLDRYQIVNADGTVNTDATYDGKVNETYDMRTMIHAIHGAEKRDNPIVIYRSRGIYAFATADTEKPLGWPEEGSRAIYGSTNGSEITHNWIVVHYPKPPNECEACHNEEAFQVPDQTKAVALTIDPGDDYPDQSDDTVIGPTAAACTACHYSLTTREHTVVNGYKGNVTKDEMLERAK